MDVISVTDYLAKDQKRRMKTEQGLFLQEQQEDDTILKYCTYRELLHQFFKITDCEGNYTSNFVTKDIDLNLNISPSRLGRNLLYKNELFTIGIGFTICLL